MESQVEAPRLRIETETAVYEVELAQVQIEITGRCNMRCEHCRAAYEPKQDMPLKQIVKVIRFARQFSPNHKEVVVSGGEPLLHKRFAEVLRAIRHNGGEFVTLTTNGSIINGEHLNLIESLEFERFILSVSLDSLNPEDHDAFRNTKGAFEKAVRAIKLIVAKGLLNVMTSVRTTIRPHQIDQMEAMVDFVHGLGCQRSSFSAIHPAGRSIGRPNLWMTRDQKQRFIEKIYMLKDRHPGFQVSTNDPLKCIVRGRHDIGEGEELVFDGCAAAALTFNVGADGTMTPCALLNIPMMNTFGLTIKEMTLRYQQSDIVRNMLDMNLRGKCGKCALKYQCGGCRARALIRKGHYLEEDPDCWL